MNKTRLIAVFLLSGLHQFSAPVQAHHGQSALDLNKKITLSGTVTNFEWVNPHAHFSFDVKDENAKVQNWTIELSTPLMMQRLGWTKTILKPGDTVTATFFPAKNGSTIGFLESVQLADGTVLSRGGSTHAGETGVKP